MGEQTYVQVRLDSKLKQDATKVLDEIGMDMPNAIRMFLKRIVIEKGLPFDARLPAEFSSELGAEPVSTVQTIPAKPAVYVPVKQFISVICRVPEGQITRWEDIELFFKGIYAAQRIEVESFANWSKYRDNTEVPYWRIVGTHGFIPDDSRAGGKERQIARLQEEGLSIEPCGPGGRSRRVANHKQFLFDISQIDENEIRQEGYGNTIYSAMADMMLNPEMYRGFTENQLRQLASYDDGENHKDKLAKCADYAQAELSRRGIEILQKN